MCHPAPVVHFDGHHYVGGTCIRRMNIVMWNHCPPSPRILLLLLVLLLHSTTMQHVPDPHRAVRQLAHFALNPVGPLWTCTVIVIVAVIFEDHQDVARHAFRPLQSHRWPGGDAR